MAFVWVLRGRDMRKADSRKYRLVQIKTKADFIRGSAKGKRGRRYDSKLDRRGMK